MSQAIAYYRVSTQQQGRNGLGIEAQKAAVARFAESEGIDIVAEHIEVESGKEDHNRPELQRALEACKVYGAVLVIAKLDRLSRDPHFLFGLQKAGVKFVAGKPVPDGWIVGPKDVIADCWSQHDYLTIGPNKISDMVARVAVANREKLYARTRAILQQNLPVMSDWAASFDGFLEFRPPKAGALCLMRYQSPTPSYELCERIRSQPA